MTYTLPPAALASALVLPLSRLATELPDAVTHQRPSSTTNRAPICSLFSDQTTPMLNLSFGFWFLAQRSMSDVFVYNNPISRLEEWTRRPTSAATVRSYKWKDYTMRGDPSCPTHSMSIELSIGDQKHTFGPKTGRQKKDCRQQ